ncbi:MAG: hypothetical protein PHV81_02300 [Candidatus Methanomethylophilaceae archaeon]|jgi:hypothetical protein|nr:hypothetical protein [Candidatus Methanomethylophilaceae archaeon]MDD3351703.1 hypothetical protein [Candidatus Methanomethylophilaceae archaeon]MDD3986167.1 hypothetical protein [Candidatus Methanomethylophilaceae archaeon]MDD4709028.1 hypothetical protein [Candidatus Methanomethylophilaceae archaeon]MDY0251817.1 hypothetical protein [Candidatus Methanomethylophilaceae archaeon]
MQKKTDNTYICPFCFNAIDLAEIHYQCTNQSCTRMFVKAIDAGKVENGKAFRSESEDEEIDVENSTFLGRNPDGKDSVRTRQHIVRNSTGVCDICHRPVHKRLCPVCHSPIPQEAEGGRNIIFVVIGARGAGKSHYISVLINHLKNSFAPEFDAIVAPASDRTTLKYREYYYKRLYEDGRKLPPTRTYENIKDFREPMIYYVRFPDREGMDSATLAFFDTAGEGPSDNLTGVGLKTFLSSASGIVYLIDPLQIPYVNKRVRAENIPEPSQEVAGSVSDMSDLIRSAMGIPPTGKIPIPLAVVLTKCDILLKSPENDEEEKVLLDASSSVRMPRERGKIDRDNFRQIDAELNEYLRRAVSRDFIDTVEGFERHCFFAVSALGCNPEGSILNRGISPFRVEDPLIWMLGCYEKEASF